MNNKKRWSRVAISACGIAAAITVLPADAVEWIRFIGGCGLILIPAYWSNSDKLFGDKNANT